MIDATLDRPAVASAPDEVLMKHISRRRHDALAELYGRHSKRLRATIDGVVHEEAEADDVLQEIFIQVWEEAGRYSAKAGKPLGWMVTIARRRAIDRLRRRQAYSRARERYEKRVVQESQTPRRDAAEAFAKAEAATGRAMRWRWVRRGRLIRRATGTRIVPGDFGAGVAYRRLR